MTVGRAGLVVLIPEADVVVGAFRALHDPMAGRGVPAHVTVLHPFRSPVDERTANEVEEICTACEPFAARFDAVKRFPGEVVWLEPKPVDAFAALSRAAVSRFPDCPPYGGAFGDPIPHLTVGQEMTEKHASTLSAELRPLLPITAHVTELTLLVEDHAGMWTIGRTWPLGGLTQ